MGQYIRNYEVVRDLGSGHFGTVHLAVGEVPARGPRPPVRRLVAIKQLRDSADAEAVGLLLQEFALLDQVKHRGIVRVFEYLEDENAVVMEYIHGVSLRQVLDELSGAKEQVFTESATEIGCELADALYQAFTTPGDNGDPLQLVHRDLKPANVMLTPNGEVKILDFGLARVDNKEFAADDPDRIKGTPIYMAPEQARGDAIDHRTDLFTLGLILYELLMNQPAYRVPMDAPDPMGAVFDAIESGDLQGQCKELESRLPALGPVVTRLLQPRPADRFQNGQDVLVDLRRQLYRDRGAYLREFCEFFFGTIKPIGPSPQLEDFGSSGALGGRGGRKSIEERLRESMARDARSKRTTGSPPSKGKGSSAPPPSGGEGPTQPPGSPKAGPKIKQVGERRPNETGMLEMVGLNADLDELAASTDPSATQFFAIPAPKAERSRPAGGAGAAPAAPPRGPGGPPPPPGGMNQGAPPPPPGIGLGAPAGPVAQGPVAGVGGAVGQTPFQTTPPPPTHMTTDQRVQSNRVYAIVLGMVMLVCVAILVLVIVTGGDDDKDKPTVKTGLPAVAMNTPSKRPARDTGKAPPSKVKAAPRQPRAPRVPGNAPTPPRPTTPAPPSAGRGTVIVRLQDTSMAHGGELTCPGGYRVRKSFTGGVAQWTGVPSSSCTLHFRGGIPARYQGVQAGRNYSCNIIGTTAVCR